MQPRMFLNRQVNTFEREFIKDSYIMMFYILLTKKRMIEVCEANKQKDVKKLLSDKVLLNGLKSEKFAGAQILLTKLEQIKSK